MMKVIYTLYPIVFFISISFLILSHILWSDPILENFHYVGCTTQTYKMDLKKCCCATPRILTSVPTRIFIYTQNEYAIQPNNIMHSDHTSFLHRRTYHTGNKYRKSFEMQDTMSHKSKRDYLEKGIVSYSGYLYFINLYRHFFMKLQNYTFEIYHNVYMIDHQKLCFDKTKDIIVNVTFYCDRSSSFGPFIKFY